MTFEAILADLKKGRYQSVYFLCGEETYFIDEIVNFIEKNALPADAVDFNQTIVYGQDTDVAGIVANAKRFPMMSDRQVVIVKEAQNVKDLVPRKKGEGDDAPSDNKKETKTHPLVGYVENPQPSTVLVICYMHKTIDKRSALARSLQKNAVFFESEKIKDYKLEKWISEYIVTKGYNITPRASALAAEFLGADLGKVNNEFEKLFLNLPQGSLIDEVAIEKYIGVSKEYNIFELNNALGKRNAAKAYQIVNYFAENPKNYPIPMVLATLYGYFAKLMLVASAKDKSEKAVAPLIGVSPFIVKDYISAAQVYPFGKLRLIMDSLRTADLQSKGFESPSLSDKEILNELLFKIVN